MSTPKKIRDAYENTFKRLIVTSQASKKIRQFLSEIHKPTQIFNLPLKLSDVGTNLFASPKPASKTRAKRSTTQARTARKTSASRVRKKG